MLNGTVMMQPPTTNSSSGRLLLPQTIPAMEVHHSGTFLLKVILILAFVWMLYYMERTATSASPRSFQDSKDLTSKTAMACGPFPQSSSMEMQLKWSQCWSGRIQALPGAPSLAPPMQHMLQEILRALLGDRVKVILLDLASFENKGDPAIGHGELQILDVLGVEVLFTCTYGCGFPQWKVGQQALKHHGKEHVTLLVHGGGNVGTYPERDQKRFEMMTAFPDIPMVMMPQSVFFSADDAQHLATAIQKYSSHPNLTILLRNQHSYDFIQSHMPSVHAVLSPDGAYGMGPVPRFMPPVYDILIMMRQDKESVGSFGVFRLPPNVRYSVRDWTPEWPTPTSKDLSEQLQLYTYNGMLFLQRGRVIVTDRLHPYIFSTCMDGYPAVLLDNASGKIQDFVATWGSLQRARFAHSLQAAVDAALELIKEFYPDRAHELAL